MGLSRTQDSTLVSFMVQSLSSKKQITATDKNFQVLMTYIIYKRCCILWLEITDLTEIFKNVLIPRANGLINSKDLLVQFIHLSVNLTNINSLPTIYCSSN